MDLVEAAVWVLGHSEGANAVKDAASRYLIEAFDSGWPGPRPPKPAPAAPELQPHQEGYVKPGEPTPPLAEPHTLPDDKPGPPINLKLEPELWAVIALSDGTWGLWHPREQSVLSSPREGLPYTAAIARRDSLNEELLRTVYGKPGQTVKVSPRNVRLAASNSPPSTPPAKSQPTHPSGLVHHYADEAEAQRLAQESQDRLRK